MSMELFVEAGHPHTFLLELIVAYLKLADRGKVKIVHLSQGALTAMKNGTLRLDAPALVTKDGEVVHSPPLICRRLIEILPQWRSFFLGCNEAESSEITAIRTQIKQGKQLRKSLNKYFEPRTFAVSNHLTIADLDLFTGLYDTLIDLTDEQKHQYNNLFRWYKHIQNLTGVREFLEQSKRFLVKDPAWKVPFVAEKKKAKKEKEGDGNDTTKDTAKDSGKEKVTKEDKKTVKEVATKESKEPAQKKQIPPSKEETSETA